MHRTFRSKPKAVAAAFATAGAVALAVWLSPPGRADVQLTITVHTATAAMANAASSQTPATIACPAGSALLGGGFREFANADGNANATTPNNGLNTKGSAPSDAAANVAANAATSPAAWTVFGGFGGTAEANDSVTAFGMCSSNGPTKTEVVTTTVSGPQNAGTTAAATATCPSGTSLVGGGGLTNNATTQPGFTLIGSFPSDPNGGSSLNGATNPTAWTAVGAAGGNAGTTNATTAYAICATDAAVQTVVARTDVLDSPQAGTSFAVAIANCPAGTALLGGGARADGAAPGADGNTPQQGVHIRGSFPSNSTGAAVGDGAGLVTSWAAIVQSGGQATPGTDSHAWALCASSSTAASTTTASTTTATTTTTTPVVPQKITLSGLATVELGATHPKLSFTVAVTKTADLTIVLSDSKGRKLASWSKHESAGSHGLSLAIPAAARHAGHDTVRVSATGAKAAVGHVTFVEA